MQTRVIFNDIINLLVVKPVLCSKPSFWQQKKKPVLQNQTVGLLTLNNLRIAAVNQPRSPPVSAQGACLSSGRTASGWLEPRFEHLSPS